MGGCRERATTEYRVPFPRACMSPPTGDGCPLLHWRVCPFLRESVSPNGVWVPPHPGNGFIFALAMHAYFPRDEFIFFLERVVPQPRG